MRLELNLPALERLLGGDTEAEVHLRHQIVEEFARKHIKAFLNDEGMKRVGREWKEAVDKFLEDKLKELWNDRAGESVPHSTRWRISEVVQKAVEQAISENIQQHEHYYSRLIKERIESSINKEIDRVVEREIQRRLDLAKKMGKEDTNAI